MHDDAWMDAHAFHQIEKVIKVDERTGISTSKLYPRLKNL